VIGEDSEKYQPDEIEHGFWATRQLVSARTTPAPTSLWLLEVEDRPNILFNLAKLIRGRHRTPIKWPPTDDPLYVALSEPDKRLEYLRRARGNVELLIQAFELVEVYDAAIHEPWRWPDFDWRLDVLESVILTRVREGA
jgi:hypothetical protein